MQDCRFVAAQVLCKSWPTYPLIRRKAAEYGLRTLPSRSVLAQDVGLLSSAALRCVKQLEEAGAISAYGASLTGEMDYLLRVVVEDMAHYSRFIMDTLLKHLSVQDCKTSFVLNSVKTTTVLPV